jgi:hypothetical protein
MQLIVIPSGRPPVLLPVGKPEAPASSNPDLLSGNSGLLDSSAALASATVGQAGSFEKAAGRADRPKIVPTDEVILAWCEEVQSKTTMGKLAPSAFRYWARYTFDVLSPEFKVVSARISELLGEQ